MARNDRIDIEEALGAITIFHPHRCNTCGLFFESQLDPDKVLDALDRAGFEIVRRLPGQSLPGQADARS